MCTASVMLSTLEQGASIFSKAKPIVDIANSAINYRQQTQNLKYQQQVALSNAKRAQENAFYEQQLGIEKSRLDRIDAIKNANYQKAQNSASGFDISSTTSKLNIDDVLSSGFTKAELTKKSYDLNALNYFNQSNDYLKNANLQKAGYKNNLYSMALNSLGKTLNVADSWYDDEEL